MISKPRLVPKPNGSVSSHLPRSRCKEACRSSNTEDQYNGGQTDRTTVGPRRTLEYIYERKAADGVKSGFHIRDAEAVGHQHGETHRTYLWRQHTIIMVILDVSRLIPNGYGLSEDTKY